MLFTAIVALTFVIAPLLILLKVRSLEKVWQDAGIPHESYASYLHSIFVRYRRENVFDVLQEYATKYGNLYGTYHGLSPLLRVSRLDVARDVLIRQFGQIHSRSIDIRTGVPIWDRSLVAQPYNKWKTLRHLSGTGMTSSKLRAITPKIERIAKRFVTRLAEAGRVSGEVSPFDHTMYYGLDCIAAVAFGVDVDTMVDPENKFVKHTRTLLSSQIGFFLFTTMPSLIKYVPFIGFPNKASAKFIEEFAVAAIKRRRQANSQTNDGQDLLDVWLREQQANPAFTDADIAAQIFFFTLAGSDTTAYTLYLTMYFLAIHPDVQAKAYEEIKANPLAQDGMRTFDDFGKLKFVEACILETLRLCPTDFVVDRLCDEACNVAGLQLSAGTHVQVAVPVIQKDPSYFPQPELYRPDRFLDGSSSTEAFLAFGDGPKVCIGKRIALLEITIALTCLLEHFSLERCSKTPQTLEFFEGMAFLPYPKQFATIAIKERQRLEN